MASFALAMQDLDGKEGRRVNNAHDRGGDTYRGISRRYHPAWSGWAQLDSGTATESELERAVHAFYRVQFWQAVGGDQISSQRIATELFEQAAHRGPKAAGETLQRAMNVMNARGQRWPDLKPDGHVGPTTVAALRQCLAGGYEDELWHVMNVLHCAYLVERMEADPSQEEFAIGWIRRTMR